jgi:hypothetical protein
VGSTSSCVEIGEVGSQPAVTNCASQGTSVPEVFGIAALIALLLAPIVTTAYLAVRMRRAFATAVA